MHLLEHLSNLSPSQERVLDAFPDGLPERRRPIAPPPPRKRLGNGVVQRAIVRVLAAADEPLSLAAIHQAVEARLGQSVSNASVTWCLHMGSKGDDPRFERVSIGVYRLGHP
jgi:hypothetical protein